MMRAPAPAAIRTARRVDRFTYAIRNIVAEAKKVEATGQRVRYLNIGDPNQFGFVTPPHLIEAVAKFGDVLSDAPRWIGAIGNFDRNSGERQVEQLLHFRHRRHETRALVLAEGLEGFLGEFTPEPIELLELPETGTREASATTASIRFEGFDFDEAVPFDRTQQPTEVTRVEVQPGAKLPNVRTFFSDLE